jgi:MFS transporter, SP family, arabinose:H+ symporter
MNYLLRLTLVGCIGGFLFGYDTAVIAGTVDMVRTQFGLTAVGLGWYVSSALLGCVIGVAAAGMTTDRLGSRTVLLGSSLLFIMSGIGCALAGSMTSLIAYRVIGGIAIGIASMACPLYIAEVAPPAIRGRLVACYQAAITLGILAAYLVNASLLHVSQLPGLGFRELSYLVFVAEPWRAMLGSGAIPAILFLLGLVSIPQSPRWLALRGRDTEARSILARVSGAAVAEVEFDAIKQSLADRSQSLALLLKPGFFRATVIGVSLAFFTQASGINAVIYYGPTILAQGGLGLNEAFGGQVAIGVVNALATLIALVTIDRFGRRPLLIVGISGLILSLIVVGTLFFFETKNTALLLAGIMTYIVCFAFSYGPVIWVLLSEIYPTPVRGAAMSLATMSLWIGTLLTGQLTPWLLETLGAHGTFWIFAVCTAPALFITIRFVPETRRRSLEQIEAYWLSFGAAHSKKGIII